MVSFRYRVYDDDKYHDDCSYGDDDDGRDNGVSMMMVMMAPDDQAIDVEHKYSKIGEI